MTATGFGLLLWPLLSQVDSAFALTLGEVLEDVWAIAFVALILTFVTGGRLETAIDRLIVGAFVMALLILDVISMLFLEQPDNLLLAFPNETIADAFDATQRVLLICAEHRHLPGGRVRGGGRRRRPRRRALLPSVAGAGCVALFVWLLVTDLFEGPRSQLMIWVAYCSMLAVPAAFLAGLLRSRLARGGLAQLFRELGGMRGEALQAALARTLGDPTLVLAYRLHDSPGHADADGRPVLVPPVTADRAIAPIERDGDEVAAIVYDALLDDDPEMVEAVSRRGGDRAGERASAGGVGGAAGRGEGVTRAHRRGGRRRAPPARARPARRRPAAARRHRAAAADRSKANPDDPALAEELVKTASDELAQSLSELRELARGIHPAVLDHGLAGCARVAGGSVAGADRRDVRPPEHVPEQFELAAYFVACEALANVGKYADATQRAVRVWRSDGDGEHRDRRRRHRRRRRRERLRPARPGRPRRGARRPAARHAARPAPGPSSPRSCHAGRDRRRQPAHARGHRVAPAARRHRRGRRRPRRPTSCCARSPTHEPDVAIVDIRMPPTFTDEGAARGARDPRAPPTTSRS